MKHLLDVSVLLARLLHNHQDNAKTTAWLAAHPGIVLCPIAELGFLRISTVASLGFPMKSARQLLEDFVQKFNADWIPDDLPALESHPRTSKQVTDHYLAELAAKHGLKLATLDAAIKHPAVEIIR